MKDLGKICLGCMREKPSAGGACPHCGFDAENYDRDSRWLPLKYILNGKYMLGKVLGEGGFGITYIGWDLNLKVRVAIKEYFPIGLASRESVERNHYSLSSLRGEKRDSYKNGLKKFVEEAQSLSRFYHLDGIVAVKELFFENETAYMVMEYLDGVTLKEYLKERGGQIGTEEALKIMEPVLRSLAEIHKAGIIHRDISTDNIMITRDGKTKLIDFGSARTWDIGGNKTFTIVLKHGYAPPEQYQTKGKQGAWTDIYAACATIYRMITGQLPPNAMDRLGKDTLQTFAQLGYKVPDYVEHAVVKNGLALRAEQRYTTVEELYAALYPHEKEGGKARRHIKLAAVAGVSVFVLLLLWVGAGMPRKNESPADQTLVARVETEEVTEYQTEKLTETDIKTETETETATEKVTGTEAETTPEKVAETETETVTKKATKTEAETTTEKVAETETETVTKKATKTEAETATEKATETETETVTEKVTGTEAMTESETETETETETESESETQAAEAFAIDAAAFPDEIFRAYVQEKFDTDKDGVLTQAERDAAEEITIDPRAGVKSLKGVERFSNLKKLICNNNELSELDVSKNAALAYLDCENNHLSKLDISRNAALENLICDRNELTELDVSQNEALEKLSCFNNRLSKLDVSRNTALENLSCAANELDELDISANTALTYLDCSQNRLSKLDVSRNTKLEKLSCSGNRLSSLDVRSNQALTGLSTGLDDEQIIRETETAVSGSGTQEAGAFAIDEKNFPDDIFRTYVQDELDKNKDGWMSQKEIARAREIDVSDMKIQRLKGVELFPKLRYLNCSSNRLKELDVSRNTELERLECNSNKLEVLDVSQNTKLERLECNSNKLEVLDVSQNTELERLSCGWNQIEELDMSQNTKLERLDCSNGQLKALDISQNTKLEKLDCGTSQLETLDVTNNTELKEIDCRTNKIRALDVSQNKKLTGLNCKGNRLTSLDVSQNKELTGLSCGSNRLTSLDVSQNKKLAALNCESNQLTSLDVSQNEKLQGLCCYDNHIYELDISQNPKLSGLWWDHDQLMAMDRDRISGMSIQYGKNGSHLNLGR